jgi:hypothetical protein
MPHWAAAMLPAQFIGKKVDTIAARLARLADDGVAVRRR